MYDVFGECLNLCVKRLDRGKVMNTPEEMARYYFSYSEDVPIYRRCNFRFGM